MWVLDDRKCIDSWLLEILKYSKVYEWYQLNLFLLLALLI